MFAVMLDFTGVNVVSNSFFDECIAKLLLEMPLSELKRHTTFRDTFAHAREYAWTEITSPSQNQCHYYPNYH